MHSTSHPLYTLHISTLSVSVAFSTHTLSSCCSLYCFYPSGCPIYRNNIIFPVKILQLNFALLTIALLPLDYLFVLCVKSQHHGIASRKSQLPNKCPPSLLRWSDPFFPSSISPIRSSTAQRQKEVRTTEVLFGYLFMGFPFNIHAFFRTIWVQRRICCLGGSLGQKIRFQLQ